MSLENGNEAVARREDYVGALRVSVQASLPGEYVGELKEIVLGRVWGLSEGVYGLAAGVGGHSLK